MDANGVRDVNILQKNGRFAPKSIFPESWDENDIVSAILESSEQGFSKMVTRKGITIKVNGYSENGIISTGFPDVPLINP